VLLKTDVRISFKNKLCIVQEVSCDTRREKRKTTHTEEQKSKADRTIFIEVHAIKELKSQLYKAEDTD